MSFMLELPQMPSGDTAQQIGAIYSYLFGLAAQLNYALGFLSLPGSAPEGSGETGGNEGRVAEITGKSTHAQTASARAVYEYAVPQTRQINLHELSEDLFLTAEDVDGVPITRTINGRPLTDDVHLVPTDLNIADHVYTHGEIGNWSVRRWVSGKIEAWGTSIPVTPGIWTAYTTELMTSTAAITLPVEFADKDYTIVANVVHETGTDAGVLSVGHVSGTAAAVVLICDGANTKTNYNIDVYVCGADRRG